MTSTPKCVYFLFPFGNASPEQLKDNHLASLSNICVSIQGAIDLLIVGESLHGVQDASGLVRDLMLTERDAARADRRDGNLSNGQAGPRANTAAFQHLCYQTPTLLSTVHIDPLSIHNPDSVIVGTGKFSITRVVSGSVQYTSRAGTPLPVCLIGLLARTD